MNLTGSLPGIAPTLPPGQIELHDHERAQVDPLIEQCVRGNYMDADFHGRVYRAVKRKSVGHAAVDGGFVDSVLAIEVDGKELPIAEGVKALWRFRMERRAEMEARNKAGADQTMQAEYRLARWKSLTRIERALRVAIHDTAFELPTVEMQTAVRVVLELLLDAHRRDPQSPPEGIKF